MDQQKLKLRLKHQRRSHHLPQKTSTSTVVAAIMALETKVRDHRQDLIKEKVGVDPVKTEIDDLTIKAKEVEGAHLSVITNGTSEEKLGNLDQTRKVVVEMRRDEGEIIRDGPTTIKAEMGEVEMTTTGEAIRDGVGIMVTGMEEIKGVIEEIPIICHQLSGRQIQMDYMKNGKWARQN